MSDLLSPSRTLIAEPPGIVTTLCMQLQKNYLVHKVDDFELV